jgi:beta-phosphoglucomutase family hydrolase
MLEAVIFDMDGVLVDSHAAHKRAWQRFLDSVGRTVTEAELEFIFDGRKKDDILRFFLGELSSEDIRSFGQRKEAFFRQEVGELRTIPGVQEFLEHLERGQFRLAVASAGSNSRVYYVLEYLGLQQYFDTVVAGDDVSSGKPDPAIFRLASARLGVDADRAIVFEDSVSGIKAAKAAGMKCVGIGNASRAEILLKAGANQVIADFTSSPVGELHEFFQYS